MKQSLVIKVLVVVVILILGGALLFLLGDRHAVNTLTFKRVNPTQLANAMKGDYFYSNYRENTLLVEGTVSAIHRTTGDTVVGFKTTSSYQTNCDFGSSAPPLHPGETLTVLSEGGVAVRQPSGVLLKDCLIP